MRAGLNSAGIRGFLFSVLVTTVWFSLTLMVMAQTATAPASSPPQPSAPALSAQDEEVLLKKARELGIIPPGMTLPAGVSSSMLKELVGLHGELETKPPVQPTPKQPAPPATGTLAVEAAPTAPPSAIEQSFSPAPKEEEKARPLKQFGYDLFGMPSTTFAPTETVTVGPDYQLAPGDELIVYVWGKVLEETLRLTVDRDGQIMLPKLGPLAVAGMRFDKATEVIVAKLSGAYANLQITVGLGRLHTISVRVVGEVAKPGTYTVSPFATLLNVLYEAGGPTKVGSMRQIKLTRGQNKPVTVDLYKFFTEGDLSQDHKLLANDVIFVPPVGPVAAMAGHVKRPAIFELSGETTALQLFNLAGGILLGEAQRIQVERYKTAAGRTVEELNFASADERVKQLGAFKIQDGDLLTVYPPAAKRYNFVSISGLVPHPGDYELKPNMTLKDVIERAGGVTPTAFLKRVELVRFLTERPADTIRVDVKDVMTGDPKWNVELKEFDRVRIYDYGFVSVTGMVWKPDNYQWVRGITVKEALEKAGGVRPGAWLKRGEIVRRHIPEGQAEGAAQGGAALAKPVPEKAVDSGVAGGAGADGRDEVIPFDVTAVLSGDKDANKVLYEYDLIRIYDSKDVLPAEYVTISGAVYKPGTYRLTPNMTVTDLIFKAGGLRRNALVQQLELFRTEIGAQPKVMTLNMEEALAGKDKQNDIELADQDVVFVRRNVYLDKRSKITLSGEVRYPGDYFAEPGERLSSVIKRAGGYTEKAYLPAAVFNRTSIQEAQKASIERFVHAQREGLLREESVKPTTEVTEAERKAREASLLFRRQLLDLVATVDVPGRMVIRLDAIEKFAGSRDDVLIEDGDVLFVPPTPAVVQVIGAVYNSTALTYEEGKNLDYYLAKVGGATREADKNQIYIIRANGEVEHKFARVMVVERGDTVVVPLDVRIRPDWRQMAMDTSRIIANLAIGAAVVTR